MDFEELCERSASLFVSDWEMSPLRVGITGGALSSAPPPSAVQPQPLPRSQQAPPLPKNQTTSLDLAA